MEIRRANPDDTNRLREVAIAAKRHWGFSDDWMSEWASRLTLTPEYVRDYEVYAACIGSEIIGFSAIVLDERVCILDHIWVVPEHMRQGIGRALFAHARQRAVALGAERMEWDAEPDAVGFYERLGGRTLRTIITSMGRTAPVMGLELTGPTTPDT